MDAGRFGFPGSGSRDDSIQGVSVACFIDCTTNWFDIESQTGLTAHKNHSVPLTKSRINESIASIGSKRPTGPHVLILPAASSGPISPIPLPHLLCIPWRIPLSMQEGRLSTRHHAGSQPELLLDPLVALCLEQFLQPTAFRRGRPRRHLLRSLHPNPAEEVEITLVSRSQMSIKTIYSCTHDNVSQDIAERNQSQQLALPLLCFFYGFSFPWSSIIDYNQAMYSSHPDQGEH